MEFDDNAQLDSSQITDRRGSVVAVSPSAAAASASSGCSSPWRSG